jgi:hypothetical protein
VRLDYTSLMAPDPSFLCAQQTHSTLTGGGDNNQTVLGEHEMHLLSTTDGVRIDPMASGHLMKDGVKLGGKKVCPPHSLLMLM